MNDSPEVTPELKVTLIEALLQLSVLWEGGNSRMESVTRGTASFYGTPEKQGELLVWLDQETNPIVKEVLTKVVDAVSRQFLYSMDSPGSNALTGPEIEQFRKDLSFLRPSNELPIPDPPSPDLYSTVCERFEQLVEEFPRQHAKVAEAMAKETTDEQWQAYKDGQKAEAKAITLPLRKHFSKKSKNHWKDRGSN